MTLKNESTAPATMANAGATSLFDEIMVLSFGYFDPLRIPQGGEGKGDVEARVFSQVAMPRTAFAEWLKNTLQLMSSLPDRETFGWKEIAKLVEDTQAASA